MEESYSSTEVVLVSELIKVVVTAIFTLTDKTDTNSDSAPHPFSRLLALLMSAQKVIVLVILYSVANLLSYYALARVDAAVYTVLLQVRLLHVITLLLYCYKVTFMTFPSDLFILCISSNFLSQFLLFFFLAQNPQHSLILRPLPRLQLFRC